MPILENPLKSDSESANTAWLDALADIAEPSASPKPRTKMKQRRNPLFTNPTFSLSHNICDRFPSELHDQIIDHLHNDKHSLANCSLVCKAWLTSARYHLFQNASTIRIHRKNFPQFYELLATGRLSEYIGRLEIEQGGSHRVAAFPGEDGDDKVFQFDDHLRQFTGLASLKYLRLGWIDPNDGPELCISLAQNFSSLVELELVSVILKSSSMFEQIVHTLPLLRRLALRAVSLEDEESAGAEPVFPLPVGLQDLVVDCSYPAFVFRWLCSRPTQLSIRKFALGRQADATGTSPFLQALGPSLENLILFNSNKEFPFDLTQNVRLRSLKITGIRIFPSANDESVTWVPALLAQIGSSCMERIVFLIHLEDKQGLQLLDWPQIADILAGPKFMGLRRVEFSLSGHKNWATQFIREKLEARHYLLLVGLWKRRYEYALDVFDTQ